MKLEKLCRVIAKEQPVCILQLPEMYLGNHECSSTRKGSAVNKILKAVILTVVPTAMLLRTPTTKQTNKQTNILAYHFPSLNYYIHKMLEFFQCSFLFLARAIKHISDFCVKSFSFGANNSVWSAKVSIWSALLVLSSGL